MTGPVALPENPIEAFCRTGEGDPALGRVAEEFLLALHAQNPHPHIREAVEIALYDLHGLMEALHGLLEEIDSDPDLEIEITPHRPVYDA